MVVRDNDHEQLGINVVIEMYLLTLGVVLFAHRLLKNKQTLSAVKYKHAITLGRIRTPLTNLRDLFRLRTLRSC